jgi:hypothetical protein
MHGIAKMSDLDIDAARDVIGFQPGDLGGGQEYRLAIVPRSSPTQMKSGQFSGIDAFNEEEMRCWPHARLELSSPCTVNLCHP